MSGGGGARDLLVGLERQRPQQARDAGLDDPGLLARDLAQRDAEVIGVVEPDARDRRGGWLAGRDGVEAAPEARLEHGHLDARLSERQKGQHRRELEIRERYARRREPHVEGREPIAVHLGPRHANSLREAAKVRGRVEARAEAGRAKDGLGHGCRRALAVRAGDLDGSEPALRVAEPRQGLAHAREPELDAQSPRGLEARQELGVPGRGQGPSVHAAPAVSGPVAPASDRGVRASAAAHAAERCCPGSRARAGTRRAGSRAAGAGGSCSG